MFERVEWFQGGGAFGSGDMWPVQVGVGVMWHCEGAGLEGGSWDRGEGVASNFVCHFIALDAYVGFDLVEGDGGAMGASVFQGCLDGFQHVVVYVDVHEVWLHEVFVDLQDAAEAVCEDVDVGVGQEAHLDGVEDGCQFCSVDGIGNALTCWIHFVGLGDGGDVDPCTTDIALCSFDAAAIGVDHEA